MGFSGLYDVSPGSTSAPVHLKEGLLFLKKKKQKDF